MVCPIGPESTQTELMRRLRRAARGRPYAPKMSAGPAAHDAQGHSCVNHRRLPNDLTAPLLPYACFRAGMDVAPLMREMFSVRAGGPEGWEGTGGSVACRRKKDGGLMEGTPE